ncbi:hypothetical protein [Secundilactobacillus collinoides]|uniref:Integral membrane protein n=2 Tax=Secundilactobacillus collinoides TaxID=33960 RepID=A0A0R2BDH0_SECCO|nr:hypothetical protein [Secundilactobacillus collinoides]KRM77565.1 hypothetical protein FC82_GL002920 [Secundilactobacillus collinoides DSM 20515 = JCM 1123]KZL43038.1 hypothetical protein TY91_01655 [Secundilactobacillus collinoides]
MLKKQLVSLGIVSWALFSIINLLMSSEFVKLKSQISTSDMIKSLIVSGVLYFIPIIIGALGHNAGYYVLALVIIVYSVALVNVILSMINASDANMTIKAVMIFASLAALVFNGYWMILAFRYRHRLDKIRDEKKYQDIKKWQEQQKK